MTKWDEAIGLSNSWPDFDSAENGMAIQGLVRWANEYQEASIILSDHNLEVGNSNFYMGPIIQNVGMATEFTLKALATGGGSKRSDLKAIGHKTYKLYELAKPNLDEVKFINQQSLNTSHIEFPSVIAERDPNRAKDLEAEWRCYFQQLRLLDETYSKGNLSRYPMPGSRLAPEVQIVLIGNSILLDAMATRLKVKLTRHAVSSE